MKYQCLDCRRRFDEPRVVSGFAEAEFETCPFCGSLRLCDADRDRDALNTHFAEARRIVSQWPEWKRNIGYRLDPLTPGELP